MSLQVLVAHSGERITADPEAFSSLDAFKSWLGTASAVAVANQILLTGNGKQVKLQSLLSENEIFLYNRQLITPSANNSNPTLPLITIPELSLPRDPPRELSSQDDLQAWQNLFHQRRTWAQDILSRSREVSREIHKQFDANNIIERGLGLASSNLGSHVKSLEQKFEEAKAWCDQADEEQASMIASLGDTQSQLQALPGKTDFIRFLPKLPDDKIADVHVLADFVESSQVKGATATLKFSGKTLSDVVDRLGERVRKVASDANALVARVEKSQTESVVNTSAEASGLLEEIELVANKISTDYDTAMSSKSISQVSRMAQNHTRNLLPSISKYFMEMGPSVQQVVDQRNATAQRAVEAMRRLAVLESNFASVNAQVMALDLPPDVANAYDLINLLIQLPFVYGALLIEAVRRNEWAEKIKGESAVLAEDIAGYKEEEERRRKKWLKNIGHLINADLAGGSALDFELNLQPEEHEWPEATRDDISEYLQALRQFDNAKDVIEELSEAAKDLDRPTKRQAKKGKTFKMGSLHEASLGKGSMLLRDNDEVKVLRDSNLKLEEELKGQKSRVRKLEDLLYKQGQTGRSASGNLFQSSDSQSPDPATPEPPGGSPRSQNTLARKASANSRRTSMNNNTADEKALARRIVSLEAELLEERRKRQDAEKNIEHRTSAQNKVQSEIEEARSTKKDLMENMEAQQREFADERRLLNEEINKHKLRAEDVEDELDHTNTSLNNLEELIKQRDEALEDYMKTLRSVLSNLTNTESVPKPMDELVNSLGGAAEQSARQNQELTQAVVSTKSDKEALESSLKKQEDECISLRAQLTTSEQEAASLRDKSSTENARAESLAAELEDARHQLKDLREKFAEGETGSDALRQRLEHQAAKAATLATQLAESKSHVNSLDIELLNLQRKHSKLQVTHDANVTRLSRRTERDRELTNRLVARSEELVRLLEGLGLSMILNKEGNLEIQRTSKLASSNVTLTDPSGSVADFTGHTIDVGPSQESVHWMQAPTVEEEEVLFNALISQIDVFNISTFSGAIIKLRRDVEWTGKKWKNEARNYRDKFLRAQSEANSKIAYRSFKEGDLALFLPTRNQATRPWAAFNIGAPHYFLNEQEAHKLRSREWLVARISKVQERVVDLSKTLEASGKAADGRSIGESEGGLSAEDDNPFELSDGLRWYMLDATEEKFGAPSTPGLGKSTVASAAVDAKGSVRMKKTTSGNDATAKLNKSLESRRSSSNSNKRNSISGPSGKEVIADTASAQGIEGVAISRNTSTTQLRPPSQGSQSPGTFPTGGQPPSHTPQPPSGLGIQIANASDRKLIEENPNLLRPSSSGESPSKPALLTIFSSSPNSPPKPPSRWSFRNASTSPSRLAATAATQNENLKAPPLAARSSSPPKVPGVGAASSLARQLSQSSSKSQSRAASADGRGSGLVSPAKQQGTTQQKPWEPVFNVEMNLESSQSNK